MKGARRQEAAGDADVLQVLQHRLQRVGVLHLHSHEAVARRAAPAARREQLRLVHLRAHGGTCQASAAALQGAPPQRLGTSSFALCACARAWRHMQGVRRKPLHARSA